MHYMFLLFLFLVKHFRLHSLKQGKNKKNKSNPHSCLDLIDFTNINISMSCDTQYLRRIAFHIPDTL